jgi:hypothetical protein
LKVRSGLPAGIRDETTAKANGDTNARMTDPPFDYLREPESELAYERHLWLLPFLSGVARRLI